MIQSAFPSTWSTTSLESLLIHVIGGDWGKDESHDEDGFVPVKCIRGAEYRNWDKEKGATATPRKVKSSSLDSRRLREGDILIEISGGGPEQPVGRVVLIDHAAISNHSGADLVPTNFLRLARPSEHINPIYLNAYLRAFYMSGEVINYQAGSNNLRNLKFKEYVTIDVPVAPLAEQKQIADKLDELLAQVDTLKTRLDAIPAILKRFRQSVLAAAVSGRLTEEWRNGIEFSGESGALSTFVQIDIGQAFKSKEFTDSGIRLLRGQNIEPGALRWSETKYYPEEKLEEFSHLYIEEGDIILAMDRPIVSAGLKLARAKSIDLPCVLVQRVARFKKFKGLLPDFLMLLLSDISFSNYLLPNQTGSDIPHISGKQILGYDVAIPALEEQTEIVRRVEQLFTFADQIEQRVKDAQSRVNHLTQSILAKAFRGELTAEWREQNPDLISGDNSAEALLEKIKTEQAAAKPAKRSRRRKTG